MIVTVWLALGIVLLRPSIDVVFLKAVRKCPTCAALVTRLNEQSLQRVVVKRDEICLELGDVDAGYPERRLPLQIAIQDARR